MVDECSVFLMNDKSIFGSDKSYLMHINNAIDLHTASTPHRRLVRSPKISIRLAYIAMLAIVGWQSTSPVFAIDLPPDTDIPEEVLRAEIITEARSPIDGKALSANEFAELVIDTRQQIDSENASAAISDSKFRETLFLLRLRGFLKSIGIPIK
jgi:hypothetical protein